MPTGRSLLTQDTKYPYKLGDKSIRRSSSDRVTRYLRDEGAGHLYHKPMQDEGDVEQGQTAVHEDHLVDERRGELVSNLAEEGEVDQPQQSGTTPRHNAQVEPLTSVILRHFRLTKLPAATRFICTASHLERAASQSS